MNINDNLARIWLIGDTHFGHANIIRYCNRPFKTVEEMDEALIANWNARVNPGDSVLHVGDFAWRDPEKYLERLNGNILVLIGNHDKPETPNMPFVRGPVEFTVGDPFAQRLEFFADHYPHRLWPGMESGVRHLFGHVHGNLKRPTPGSMDVGVDVCNYAPISVAEVVERLRAPTLKDVLAEQARL
jgi:calcineurin-like phosphoesterase family protein